MTWGYKKDTPEERQQIRRRLIDTGWDYNNYGYLAKYAIPMLDLGIITINEADFMSRLEHMELISPRQKLWAEDLRYRICDKPAETAEEEFAMFRVGELMEPTLDPRAKWR